MLIRLMSYPKNNPEHADVLIAIDGLPREWIFNDRKDKDDHGKDDVRSFLKEPWEVDITENLPADIRFKFQPEPFTVWFESPMEIRPGTYTSAPAMEWVRWVKKAWGFRLNYQTNAGRLMWEQIMDLLERETPRTQRVAQPAIVGNKYQWTLTVERVPYVKLTGTEVEVPKEQIIAPEVKPVPRPNEYPCRTCGDIFDKERGRWMHERRKHGVKEAFIPTREKAVA